jgi:hypothetical protein
VWVVIIFLRTLPDTGGIDKTYGRHNYGLRAVYWENNCNGRAIKTRVLGVFLAYGISSGLHLVGGYTCFGRLGAKRAEKDDRLLIFQSSFNQNVTGSFGIQFSS